MLYQDEGASWGNGGLYRRLLQEHGVYVGRGGWFESYDTFFRLGYGWPMGGVGDGVECHFKGTSGMRLGGICRLFMHLEAGVLEYQHGGLKFDAVTILTVLNVERWCILS